MTEGLKKFFRIFADTIWTILKSVFKVVLWALDILVQLLWACMKFFWAMLVDVLWTVIEIVKVFDRFGIINLFLVEEKDAKKNE